MSTFTDFNGPQHISAATVGQLLELINQYTEVKNALETLTGELNTVRNSLSAYATRSWIDSNMPAKTTVNNKVDQSTFDSLQADFNSLYDLITNASNGLQYTVGAIKADWIDNNKLANIESGLNALEQNVSALNTSNSGKVSTAQFNSALGLKADAGTVNLINNRLVAIENQNLNTRINNLDSSKASQTDLNNLTSRVTNIENNSLPVGAIIQWCLIDSESYSAVNVPAGWLACDGNTIPSIYPELRELIGNSTPNLDGYIIKGA